MTYLLPTYNQDSEGRPENTLSTVLVLPSAVTHTVLYPDYFIQVYILYVSNIIGPYISTRYLNELLQPTDYNKLTD